MRFSKISKDTENINESGREALDNVRLEETKVRESSSRLILDRLCFVIVNLNRH